MLPESEELVYRFAEFELGGRPLTLRRGGSPVALQPQPARALDLLLRRAGEAVTREELREHLWGIEHHLDHEQGINFTIRKIRAALGDDSLKPRFVETLPRLGYRFVAPVERLPAAGPGPRPARSLRWIGAGVAIVLVALVALAGGWVPLPQRQPPPVPRGAHDTYLRGSYLVGRGDEASVLLGIRTLQEAVAAAPSLARAHAALADAYLKLMFTHPSAEIAAPAEIAARRAVELDPGLAEGHLALANVLFYFRTDWPGAGREFRRALELQPGAAAALHGYGLYLASLGRFEEAIDSIRQAVDLDPATVYISSDLAQVYYWARRYGAAAERARANLLVDPEHLPSHGCLIDALVRQGDFDGALRRHNALFERLGRPASGDWPEAQAQALGFLEELDAQGRNLDVTIAAIHAERGETKEALARLQTACEERSDWRVPFIAVDPRFDDLRSRPGYAKLAPCLAP